MSDSVDDATVPIVCEACETNTRVPVDSAADAIDRHNERLHDGEEVARVDPAVTDQLANIVAEELGLLDPSE